MKKTASNNNQRQAQKGEIVSKETPYTGLGSLRKDNTHTTIYVGNLSYKRTKESIKALFKKYGGVSYVNILMDKSNGKSKGFGFVQMKSNAAVKAITELNGSLLDGRTLKVSIAKESPTAEIQLQDNANDKKAKKLAPLSTKVPKRKKRDKGLKVLFNYLEK